MYCFTIKNQFNPYNRLKLKERVDIVTKVTTDKTNVKFNHSDESCGTNIEEKFFENIQCVEKEKTH